MQGKVGQVEEGLKLLDKATAIMHKTGQRNYEAELYRLKGQLTLQKFKVQSSKFKEAEGEPKSVFCKLSKLRGSSRRSPWSCER